MIDVIGTTLGQVAELRAGYPFRGSIQATSDGDVAVVQMKDLNTSGAINWSGTVRARLPGRRQPEWLGVGDLVLVTRGSRYYATALEEVPGPSVCGPHLYQLRPRSRGALLPEFLAWQLNQAPLQQALRAAAEGSNQLSIRRPVLEALPIAVPALVEQRRIINLARTAARERVILDNLIQNRERQLRALAHALSQAAEQS